MELVRVTINGPVLATLVMAEWLYMQGMPPLRAAHASAHAGGTMDMWSETAEYWVELPCELVYDLAAAPPVRQAAIRRLGSPAGRNGIHTATYLLRLEVGGAGDVDEAAP